MFCYVDIECVLYGTWDYDAETEATARRPRAQHYHVTHLGYFIFAFHSGYAQCALFTFQSRCRRLWMKQISSVVMWGNAVSGMEAWGLRESTCILKWCCVSNVANLWKLLLFVCLESTFYLFTVCAEWHICGGQRTRFCSQLSSTQ